MTTVHPVPAHHLARLARAYPLEVVVLLLFFEPTSHCLARHTKGTLKTTQTRPLMVGSQNLFTTFSRILFFRIERSIAVARIATEFLLASVGATILNNIKAAAFGTFECDRHRYHLVGILALSVSL